MSIRQLPILTVILTMLATSIGVCQSPSRSPYAETADGPIQFAPGLVGSQTSNKPPQAEESRRRGWLHQLVAGSKSDDSITKSNASQPIAPPRNSDTDSAVGGQFPSAKQSPTSTKPPQAEESRRRGWLHQLVAGSESDKSITKTNASQPLAQQRNGNPNAAAPAAGLNLGGQFAGAKRGASSTKPQQVEESRRRSWLHQLAAGGESDKSINQTNASQPVAPPRNTDPNSAASGQYARAKHSSTSTKPPQAEESSRRGWLHQLVAGSESDKSLTKTNASQPVAQQRNGNPNAYAPAAGINPSGQFAGSRQSPPSTKPPLAEESRRSGWLQQLVAGSKSDDPSAKTNPSQPLAPPRIGGPNSASLPAGINPGDQFAGSKHGPTSTTPHQAEGSSRRRGWLQQLVAGGESEKSINKTNASQPLAPPRSGSPNSAALAAGINPGGQFAANKHSPPSTKPPQAEDSRRRGWFQQFVAGSESDKSITRANASLPLAQNESNSHRSIAGFAGTAQPVRLPTLSSPESKPAVEEVAQSDMASPPAVDRYVVPVDADIPAVVFGGGQSRRNPLVESPAPSGPPLALANPFTPPQQESVQPAQGIATDSMPSFETMESHTVIPLNQTETEWPSDGAVPGIPSAPVYAADSPLGRPKIIYRPVVVGMDSHRNAVLRPDVHLAEMAPPPQSFNQHRFAQLPAGEDLPPPTEYVPETDFPVEQEWMPPPAADDGYYTGSSDYSVEHPGALQELWYKLRANLNGPRSCPPGVGVENVMNAPFWIDTTQPLNNCRLRADGAADMEFPDRAEYFWAKTPGGKGPVGVPDVGEPSVDFQDLSFYIERGTKRFSVGTELPIRSVDPQIRLNSTGFADMNLTTKALLLDGKCWQLTQIFRTYFPTGSDNRGTGNGHFSMEPGFAWRYKWSDVTYIHGDMKYWFPIAADPDFSGQILNYGIGMSHVLYDSDRWSLMPTFEAKGWTVLDGRQSLPFLPLADDLSNSVEIDTIGILNVYPGLRIIWDKGCDCGVKEFGISCGGTLTEDHWYEEILRLEFRWVH